MPEDKCVIIMTDTVVKNGRPITDKHKLTPGQRQTLRGLVKEWCANYDAGYHICAPRDEPCIMLAETEARCGCKYFREGVLPIDPILEALLLSQTVITKLCPICKKAFKPTSNRGLYCSEACRLKAAREATAKRVNKHRSKKPPGM